MTGSALLVLLMASACGGWPSSHAAGAATVDVGVVYAGGPARLALSAAPLLRPGNVTLTGNGHSYTVTTRDGQRTSVAVAAGRYTARATSGDALCSDEEITASAGRDTPVTVVCSVK